MIKILAIDDDAQNLAMITAALRQPGVEINNCTDSTAALDLFFEVRPQIVLLDLVMPGVGGMVLLEQMVAADPGVDVILLTGDYSTTSAVEAIQKGACDYLTKPADLNKLRQRVAAWVSEAKVKQRVWQLDHELAETSQFEGMIARSPIMWEAFAKIRRVAPHFYTCLVSGPTGTGKELVARSLHHLSPGASGRFAVCNCAAIADALVESELFGYVKGAFTGADHDKHGLFEYANGGTVFLDEIGELSLKAQAKLLRVLQNQEVQRVGSPAVRKVNVRIIAATNRDLLTLVSEKTFRDDLYYRLSMIEIRLPGLAERRQDIPLLQRHFLEKFNVQYKKEIKGISRRAGILLERYSWPGNVRELQNVLGSACLMAESNTIDIADFPQQIREQMVRFPAQGARARLSMEEMGSRYALEIVKQMDGNKARAAEILGISRTTLYKLLGGVANLDKTIAGARLCTPPN
jgi:DNA-binding NtrC family response regulator